MKRSDVRNLVNAVTTAKTEPELVVEELPVTPEPFFTQEEMKPVICEPEPPAPPKPVTPDLRGVSADAAYSAWLLGSQGQKLRHLGGVDMSRLHHAYADRVAAIFRAGFDAGSK